MSQPLVYDEDKEPLFRTKTDFTVISKREGISKSEAEEKIRQFEDYIKTHVGITEEQVDEGDQVVEEVLILTQEDDSEREAKFFYFIGRLNPPHSGHLKALEILVKMSNEEGSEPLILLGSGPNKGERTMDNPISFELKEHFIRKVLNEKIPGSRFKIEKMTNPAKNVSDYIRNGLQEKLANIDHIEIKHIAGGKDEDTTKLLFALKSAEKTAKDLASGAEIITEVKPIEAEIIEGETAMSATKVRKDAYNAYKLQLNGEGNGFDIWREKYGEFYGEYAKDIYNEILYPLESKSRGEQLEDIEKYLNPRKRKAEKEGGTRRKRRGTKRKSRKSRKFKKKTQKRRRLVSKRRH